MIPSRRLVLIAMVPGLLALAALFDRALVGPMLAADAAMVLIAGLDALLGWAGLVTVERSAPSVFSVGRPNPVMLEVRSRARRTLTVEVRDDVPLDAEVFDVPGPFELRRDETKRLRYRVTPQRRGAYTLGDHFVRYPTPLGLWLRQLRLPARQPIKVYPDVKAVRIYELLARQDREYALTRATRLRGGESEFERLRDYLRDDEFRNIDWKASARRQKLIAREYQIERNQNIVFMLDCGRLMTAETAGLSHLDHALNATLMMSHVAARTGDHIGLLAFDDHVRTWLPPSGGARAAQKIVQASYDLHATLVEPDYRAAFDQLALRMRKRALVVLFTHVIDDQAAQAISRLARALLPRHLPLVVLFRDVEVDAIANGDASARAEAASELYLRGAAAELIVWRDRVVRDLERSGVLTLDTMPERLTPSLVNRYLEIKARQLL